MALFCHYLQIGRNDGWTILERCVICQNDLPDTPLRKGKQSSVANLIKAAKCRQDDVLTRLGQDGLEHFSDKEVLWHSICYASFA